MANIRVQKLALKNTKNGEYSCPKTPAQEHKEWRIFVSGFWRTFHEALWGPPHPLGGPLQPTSYKNPLAALHLPKPPWAPICLPAPKRRQKKPNSNIKILKSSTFLKQRMANICGSGALFSGSRPCLQNRSERQLANQHVNTHQHHSKPQLANQQVNTPQKRSEPQLACQQVNTPHNRSVHQFANQQVNTPQNRSEGQLAGKPHSVKH